MGSWITYYQQEINKAGGIKLYFSKKIKEHSVLLKHIIKYSPSQGRIFEAGCGTAILSIFLENQGFQVTALDNDENMLQLAAEIAACFPKKPKLIKGNLLSLNLPENYFDIAFSHGVLEHFDREDVIKIINNQLKIAKIVIFVVPSNYFKEKDKIHGDEHLLSIKQWQDIIGATNGRLTEKFGYYHFQNNLKPWLYRIFKISIPPYIGFVISKK
ncbi:MAG: methyltransferase domain-containing protein [Patescibacteria group bacterium]